jgi:hypothetical protein
VKLHLLLGTPVVTTGQVGNMQGFAVTTNCSGASCSGRDLPCELQVQTDTAMQAACPFMGSSCDSYGHACSMLTVSSIVALQDASQASGTSKCGEPARTARRLRHTTATLQQER